MVLLCPGILQPAAVVRANRTAKLLTGKIEPKHLSFFSLKRCSIQRPKPSHKNEGSEHDMSQREDERLLAS